MIGYILGFFGFLGLYLFDVYTLKQKLLLKKFFLVLGVAGIVTGSIFIAHTAKGFYLPSIVQILFGVMTILFLLLLVYSIVIEVHVMTKQQPKKTTLVTTGTYALSRHPGVLWLFLGYISLGLALTNEALILAGVIFTIINVIYVFVQEKTIFCILFEEYDQYQKMTPFVIPSLTSIKTFFHKL